MLFICVTRPDFQELQDVEFQMDRLDCSLEELKELRKRVKGALLLTFERTAPRYIEELRPDYVSIPWNSDYSVQGPKLIRSLHDFEKTPQDLDALLARMQEKPADIYKIATMATSTLDALRMLLFVRRTTCPFIGLCMGELGQVSRILLPVMGGFAGFAAIDEEHLAAPGQLTYQALREFYHYDKLTPQTKLYGLIGHPITQSPSYRTHNAYFRENNHDAVYLRMDIKPEELADFFPLVEELGFLGLSVTIPLKEQIFPFLQEIDKEALEIGAVNTLVRRKDHWAGYNTDAPGGLEALREGVKGKRVVILGAGGSAKALAHVLQKEGAYVTVVNRSLERLQSWNNIETILLEKMDEIYTRGYEILINTTPEPNPIDPHHLVAGCTVMDINVKHRETPLLQAAKEKGCRVILGDVMFWNQALRQFQLWFSLHNISK